MTNRMIITGASPAYESSLLALLGSLNCNWPGHPPVLVYDLGMTTATLDQLATANIPVRKVPAFCPHWRSDFTWKPWCFHDAPAESYLWIDAGMCVLRPMDEVFACIERLGYFAVSLYNHPVAPSVPEPLRNNLEMTAKEVEPMISMSSGLHGFLKQGNGLALVNAAYELCQNPANMKATTPQHRHDQALLTLLLNKHFGPPVLADYHIYAYHDPTGPGAESRQRIWVHRRKMLPEDQAYFAQYLDRPGPAYLPTKRIEPTAHHGWLTQLRIQIAKLRGRYPGDDRVDLDKTILHGVKD